MIGFLTNFIIMACYFLLFWFIITLHDRTGRLETYLNG
ncbi:hypothetical protein AO373_0879 [Moraxella catarrhalis]|nr:hypothetical protein AO373_0879 [Moraxella catarrhalis]